MTAKTVSISEGAYNLLKNAKDDSESFTQAIIRISRKDALSKLAGILTKEAAEDLRENIKKSRIDIEERLARTRGMLR